MSRTSKPRPVESPKRGEAAWRAHRDAIAERNDRATRIAMARRHEESEKQRVSEREAERRERAELVNRQPQTGVSWHQ
jgi:hypothetical protein